MKKLIEILATALNGAAMDTEGLVNDLTVEEISDVRALADRIYQNGAGGRSLEKVEQDSLNGKLGEYALYRKLQKLGMNATQNYETVTKERWWDLKIVLLGQDMVLEVKRQPRRGVSANFTRPASMETMCQQWRNLDAVIVWTPDNNLIKPWFVMDAAALDPMLKLMQPLSSKPGFCLPVAALVDAGMAKIIE